MSGATSLGSGHSHGESALARLRMTEEVLQAFGHAATLHSPNSSRFGKCMHVGLNAEGGLAGVKVEAFLLDTWRLTERRAGAWGCNHLSHV